MAGSRTGHDAHFEHPGLEGYARHALLIGSHGDGRAVALVRDRQGRPGNGRRVRFPLDGDGLDRAASNVDLETGIQHDRLCDPAGG